jgi:hypothetical protein
VVLEDRQIVSSIERGNEEVSKMKNISISQLGWYTQLCKYHQPVRFMSFLCIKL